MKQTEKILIDKLYFLMLELYFPAILGSFLFMILVKFLIFDNFLSFFKEEANYFALILVCYYSMSFILIASKKTSNNYSKTTFCLDIISISILCLCFHYLGFLTLNKSVSINYAGFYFCAALVLVSDRFWGIFIQGQGNIYMNGIVIISTLILLISAMLSYLFKNFSWIHTIILGYCVVAFIFHFILRVKKHLKIYDHDDNIGS